MTTRDQIVEAADRLFYEGGFEHTSFAHIADAVGLSRGNFYYHFKSKDDILHAVIGRRLAHTQELLRRWEAEAADPLGRLHQFVHLLLANRVDIQQHGCPVGTLCTELSKLAHPAHGDARRLFDLFRAWLRQQFEQLGHTREADALAMHLLAQSQGVATLAQAFCDEAFMRREVQRLDAWLDQLPPGQPARPRTQRRVPATRRA